MPLLRGSIFLPGVTKRETRLRRNIFETVTPVFGIVIPVFETASLHSLVGTVIPVFGKVIVNLVFGTAISIL